jgi:hypothetical protein
MFWRKKERPETVEAQVPWPRDNPVYLEYTDPQYGGSYRFRVTAVRGGQIIGVWEAARNKGGGWYAVNVPGLCGPPTEGPIDLTPFGGPVLSEDSPGWPGRKAIEASWPVPGRATPPR